MTHVRQNANEQGWGWKNSDKASLLNSSNNTIELLTFNSSTINTNRKSWRSLQFSGNPITPTGMRLQLIRLVGTVMVPIIALLALVGYIFGGRIAEHFQNIDVRNKIHYRYLSLILLNQALRLGGKGALNNKNDKNEYFSINKWHAYYVKTPTYYPV